MSVEAPIPPPATADQGALPSELTPESAVDSAAPAPISSTTRGSAAELISEHLSLLARTGNGLSYAYTRLEIHNKPLSNLDLLEAFPHLRYIDVSENQISDIRGLGHLEYILSLDAHGNNITTVPASIDKRKYIQHANFARNRIESWNVARWPMLSWLNLNDNALKSLAFEDFSELIHLEVRGNKLETMTQLDAPKLQRLYLGANQIKSLAGLENKGHVSLVHLRGNAIETLDGLSAETKKLTYLNLRDNKISSPKEISKLGVLPNLRILVLAGNPVTQIQNYRQDVIGRLPNLERLDKEAVTKEEREEAEAYMLSQMQHETKEEPAEPAA